MSLYELKYICYSTLFEIIFNQTFIFQCTECDNVWSCCSSANPCNVNQGDCDTNEDCIGDLVCGISNCIGSEFPPNVDCCESQGNLPGFWCFVQIYV